MYRFMGRVVGVNYCIWNCFVFIDVCPIFSFTLAQYQFIMGILIFSPQSKLTIRYDKLKINFKKH